MTRRLTTLAATVIALIASAPGAVAQTQPCAKATTLRPDGRDGYQPRGDRCEGKFIAPVSGSELSIASFTRAFDDYPLDSVVPLRVRWVAPDSGPVTLQVRSVKRDVYYAMDSERPRGAREFDWANDILLGADLSRFDVGALGWATIRMGAESVHVHLPLEIRARRVSGDTAVTRRAAADSTATPYELTVFPGIDLEEVFVRVSEVSDRGVVRRVLVRSDSLQAGPYPAEEAIVIPVMAPARSGFYQVDISARARRGRRLTMDKVIFYHPGS